MTGQLGGVLFVACTAALALWLFARRPWCPASLKAVVCHVTLALVGLQLAFVVVPGGSPAWWRFAGLLLVVTPALVYVWLSAAWTALFARAARSDTTR